MDGIEADLTKLWQAYRGACPDFEPSSDFMPAVWRRIESRQSFWDAFQHLGRALSLASAAICLLLLVLNTIPASKHRVFESNYTDALAADHSAERTFYAEAVGHAVPSNGNQH